MVCVIVAACEPGTCGNESSPSAPSASASSFASASASPSIDGDRASVLSPPGVVVDHVPAASGTYVGSPSLAIMPDGTYVASHDDFGPGTHEDKTHVFASADRGAHWSKLADVEGQWWSTLFVVESSLYLFGTSRQFGHVVLRRSSDGGRTWTTPADAGSGLLTPDAGFHCAPVPIVLANGRIWRAFEDNRASPKGRFFRAFVMSAPAKSDLLSAASWTSSRAVTPDRDWLDGDFENWLEGNVVVDREGRLVDVLRVDAKSDVERAAIVHVGSDGTTARFDPKSDFVVLPGASKKFTIRFDAHSNLYWSLTNTVPQPHHGNQTDHIRNTLSLVSSPDLVNWTERGVVLHHDDRSKHAFQYVDWSFDGDDLIAVSRTAWDDDLGGAHSAHDANFLTFHRVARFRDLTTSP